MSCLPLTTLATIKYQLTRQSGHQRSPNWLRAAAAAATTRCLLSVPVDASATTATPTAPSLLPAAQHTSRKSVHWPSVARVIATSRVVLVSS